ncbi:MAG: phage tail sheath subtilisin-like domain-containing protein [Clostridia bacterium]|nr:phage tail sheath subtilisin-like domain-containing protein [Clostridia bacterium]
MMTFNATGKAPGVYMLEETVRGPIPGVSTSIAAFIGPAETGPINEPVFLTNWTQFKERFGGYINAPMVYVTHALRGFFENGGNACYFVRAGKAKKAYTYLYDQLDPLNSKALFVEAKKEGAVTNLSVKVEESDPGLGSTTVYKNQVILAGIAENKLSVTAKTVVDAEKFKPGDVVLFERSASEGKPALSEEATIDRINGSTIILKAVLGSPFGTDTNVTMRVADLAGKDYIRLNSTQGIEPGSYIKVTQSKTTPAAPGTPPVTETLEEKGVVEQVDYTNKIVKLKKKLEKNFTLAQSDSNINVTTLEFNFIVIVDGNQTKYANLSMEPFHSHYFRKIINSDIVTVTLADPPSRAVPPQNLPSAITSPKNLEFGENENIAGLTPFHYQAAIDALNKLDDVNIICIPDNTSEVVQKYLIDHCGSKKDRFAILDANQDASVEGVKDQVNNHLKATTYAAIYYPWIVVANPADPTGRGRIKIPPSGHIAGLYARTDNTRGVHKAPANDSLNGVLDVERVLDDNEQGPLNDLGINVLRTFKGRGVVVWGARTLTEKSDTQWRYINVRRLLLYIEKSIQEATRFAVFEPSNPELWATIKRQVTDFLTRVWRNGALFGAAPEQAFKVKVDEELNPASIRTLGQLIIEVVVYPVTPAEYVVFRVIQQPNGPSINE